MTLLERMTEEQGDGYTIARHILDEVATTEPKGIAAWELGQLVGDLTGGKMGAMLRELRTAYGWVEREALDRDGLKARWHITDAGREELSKLKQGRQSAAA